MARMSDKEYVSIWSKEITAKKRIAHKQLGRLTDKEYEELWN